MKTKISENLNEFFYWMRVGVVGIVLGVSLQFVRAWTEPTLPAPSGNISGPINVSTIGQSKAGGLILNTGGAINGLIVSNGNVGIGTAGPAAKLDVAGGIKIGTDVACNSSKEGTMRYNSAIKKLEFCDGANWIAIISGSPFSDCVVETSGTGGEMLTHTCTNGRSAVSGSCWRRNWGTFVGSKLNSDGTFTCRIEGSNGLDITVKCCK